MLLTQTDTRCPGCGKKFAGVLKGTIEYTCPNCKGRYLIRKGLEQQPDAAVKLPESLDPGK